jgi:hypothetical protein
MKTMKITVLVCGTVSVTKGILLQGQTIEKVDLKGLPFDVYFFYIVCGVKINTRKQQNQMTT